MTSEPALSLDMQQAQPLAMLAQAVVQHNALRLAQAEALMSQGGRCVFGLLPTLLHYNHPDLPGYQAADTPCGIINFHASPAQTALLEELLRARGSVSAAWLRNPSRCDILGLYSMGSTASLGQCCASDLDIWVCHTGVVGGPALDKLRAKCNAISQWSAKQGQELNFFLVNVDQFRSQSRQCMSKDNCGSAQQWLLLDEFYRSAVCLAGKYILWWLVPSADEERYDQTAAAILASGHIKSHEWLDLGGFNRVPAEEYFGATLWQLYKGIDSPYKAVLKTLLLEAYSADYPHTRLLSCELKEALHAGEADLLQLDPYYGMLRRVTTYLQQSHDSNRLDLARRCFYLKTCEKLSQICGADDDWRLAGLRTLLREWHWDDRKIAHLDNRDHWKIEQVRGAYKELLDTQLTSFRKLIEFARHNDITESINAEDISVLSRKLYAAFEPQPTKVMRINPQISPDLHEPELTLIEVPQGRNNSAGWYLYKQPLVSKRLIGAAAQKHTQSLIQLVSWAHFNGVLTNESDLYLYAQDSQLSIRTLHQLCADLRQSFPLSMPDVTKEDLSRPSEIRQLAVFINLTRDPTQKWCGRVFDFDVRTSDVLQFGPEQELLISQIDLLYRNSWNEVHVCHFSGDDALADSLMYVTNQMNRLSHAPDQVDLYCYSDHFTNQIRRRVADLFKQSIDIRVQESGRKSHLLVVPAGRKRTGLLFEARGVSKQQIDNKVDFYSKLSAVKLNGTAVRIDNSIVNDAPKVVEAHAAAGLIQFFLEQRDDCMAIYVVDEDNRVEAYEHYNGNKEALVQILNRYYSTRRERYTEQADFISFNLPQFYELYQHQGEWLVRPYSSEVMPTPPPEPWQST